MSLTYTTSRRPRLVHFGDLVVTTDAEGGLGGIPMIDVPREDNRSTPVPPRAEGHPANLAEALANGLVEMWRGPNVAGYALLVDTATNELVLLGYPLPEARRNDPGRVTVGGGRQLTNDVGNRLRPVGGDNRSWNQQNRVRGFGQGPTKPAA